MTATLAIALYRCEVAGEPTGSLDVQVRHFERDDQDIEAFFRAEETQSYKNGKGEEVAWRFLGVLAVESCTPKENGEEIIGFIADASQFTKWAGVANQKSAQINASSP